MDELQQLTPALSKFSPIEFALNMALCILAGFLLRYVYVRKSISLSGKHHIGTVIPLLAVIVFLVIMVVKSSLALSLGLVGALSVIRFRTPIKEPEELVYLFLAIAIGLGYGAGHTFITSVVFLVIIALIYFWLSRQSVSRTQEYNLLIDWKGDSVDVEAITNRVAAETSDLEVFKYNSGEHGRTLYLKLALDDLSTLQRIEKNIQDIVPGASCSFYEARPLQ